MRGLAFICGIGLALLWLLGLGNPAAASWLTWLDGIAAVFAFLLGGALRPSRPKTSDVFGFSLLSLGVFALWFIGMTTGAVSWQSGWTFVCACGLGIVAIACGVQRNRTRHHGPDDAEIRDRNNLRKMG